MADSPARFGEYAVEECLHRGASAEVYRVTHEGLGGFRRSYAVKAIRADRVSEAGLVALFEEEARIGGKLSHANIVQVREPGRRGDTVYIVKELVAGATLAQLLETSRGGALGLQESLSLAIEVLKALEYAHTRKVRRGNRTVDLVVPHKDLSPRNILLSLQGEVKLTNFGVPASADARPSYTAPEVLRGEPATPHADLYSCGVVLYQMLTGLHPFPSPPGRKASREVDPRPLRSQQPALPTALVEVVERSLRPHPGQRLSSATAMKNALAAVLSDAGLVPAPHTLADLVESARSAQGATTGAGSASDEERTDGDLGPAPPLRPRPQPPAGDSPAARLLKSLGEAPVRPVSESDATEIRRIPPRAAPPVRSAPPFAQHRPWPRPRTGTTHPPACAAKPTCPIRRTWTWTWTWISTFPSPSLLQRRHGLCSLPRRLRSLRPPSLCGHHPLCAKQPSPRSRSASRLLSARRPLLHRRSLCRPLLRAPAGCGLSPAGLSHSSSCWLASSWARAPQASGLPRPDPSPSLHPWARTGRWQAKPSPRTRVRTARAFSSSMQTPQKSLQRPPRASGFGCASGLTETSTLLSNDWNPS